MVLAAEDEALLVAAREDLGTYLFLAHKTDDGDAALPPRHLYERVIPAIEDDSLGHTLIVAPPGSVKTNTMIGAAGWWLGRDPTMHIAYVCNTAPEAEKRAMAVRDIVEMSGVYKTIFPGVKPNPKRGWKQDAWYLERKNLADKNPSFVAFGVGGGLGARLHRVILDDIADEDNQRTELQRQYVWKWLAETVMTRLHPEKGRAVMICTRWHEEDPAAFAYERGWTVVHIPALDEQGQSYWPEYFPTSYLACPNDEHPSGQCCMKKQLGSLGFARQYLGVVTNEDTAIFKRSWWGLYDERPDSCYAGAITVDTAGWDNQKQTGDFAVLSAWYTDGQERYYCDDVQRGRWSFNEVEQIAVNMRSEHRVPVVVEDVPWARPLIDRLKVVLGSGVIAWKVQGRSKQNRAESVAPLVEAGSVFLRRAPWNGQFIEEHASFPHGKHDDQVDTTSMALMYLARNGRPRSIVRVGLPFRRDWSQLTA